MNIDEAFDILNYTPRRREKIKSLYNLPHRKYHNLQHINNMLRWVDKDHSRLSVLLECIIYHDLQYSRKMCPPGINEAMSISLYMINKLKIHFESDSSLLESRIDLDIVSVTEAINATGHHDKDQENISKLTQLVLDLDLQSFAQSREEFLQDSENVRLELADVYGEKAFLKGHIKFLKTLLKRKRIYYVKTEWEKTARENLAWRISELFKKKS